VDTWVKQGYCSNFSEWRPIHLPFASRDGRLAASSSADIVTSPFRNRKKVLCMHIRCTRPALMSRAAPQLRRHGRGQSHDLHRGRRQPMLAPRLCCGARLAHRASPPRRPNLAARSRRWRLPDVPDYQTSPTKACSPIKSDRSHTNCNDVDHNPQWCAGESRAERQGGTAGVWCVMPRRDRTAAALPCLVIGPPGSMGGGGGAGRARSVGGGRRRGGGGPAGLRTPPAGP
jgi:hypothetical protein